MLAASSDAGALLLHMVSTILFGDTNEREWVIWEEDDEKADLNRLDSLYTYYILKIK